MQFVIVPKPIAQFRLVEKMDMVDFVRVDRLNTESRGGFGSTGAK